MFGVARRSPSRSDPRQPRLIVDLLLCAVPAVATVVLLILGLQG